MPLNLNGIQFGIRCCPVVGIQDDMQDPPSAGQPVTSPEMALADGLAQDSCTANQHQRGDLGVTPEIAGLLLRNLAFRAEQAKTFQVLSSGQHKNFGLPWHCKPGCKKLALSSPACHLPAAQEIHQNDAFWQKCAHAATSLRRTSTSAARALIKKNLLWKF